MQTNDSMPSMVHGSLLQPTTGAGSRTEIRANIRVRLRAAESYGPVLLTPVVTGARCAPTSRWLLVSPLQPPHARHSRYSGWRVASEGGAHFLRWIRCGLGPYLVQAVPTCPA